MWLNNCELNDGQGPHYNPPKQCYGSAMNRQAGALSTRIPHSNPHSHTQRSVRLCAYNIRWILMGTSAVIEFPICRTQFVHISYTVRSSFVQFSHRQCFGIATARCLGPRNNQIKNLAICPWPKKDRHQSSRAHTLGNWSYALDLAF